MPEIVAAPIAVKAVAVSNARRVSFKALTPDFPSLICPATMWH
jgi:hypothetical protein